MEKKKSWGILKFLRNVLIGFLAVVILLTATGFIVWKMAQSDIEGRRKKDDTKITVEIPKGSSVSYISKVLKEEGIIKSSFLFRFYVKNLDSASLQYGSFSFTRNLSYDEIIKILEKTVDKNSIRFTVPEGYTFAQIVNLLEEKGIAEREKLLEAYNNAKYDFDFLKDIPERENRLEGYLFPDTYYVFKDESAESILKRMLANFEKKTKDYKEKAKKIGLTPDEAVILASIIQAEGKKTSEFPLISSVLHNRLEISMKLQCCATVQYILPNRKEVLSIADTKIDSPYNTYLYAGLPVGPVSNPGLAALNAAVNPEESSYLFYRLDKGKTDGSHIFSRTYKEHEAAG